MGSENFCSVTSGQICPTVEVNPDSFDVLRFSNLANAYDYTIEIYVPAEKRKYGYYIFPLLERDRLIGRLDAQARRADDTIVGSRLWLERGVRWSNTRDDKLVGELVRQSRLCNVKEIDWDRGRIVG